MAPKTLLSLLLLLLLLLLSLLLLFLLLFLLLLFLLFRMMTFFESRLQRLTIDSVVFAANEKFVEMDLNGDWLAKRTCGLAF